MISFLEKKYGRRIVAYILKAATDSQFNEDYLQEGVYTLLKAERLFKGKELLGDEWEKYAIRSLRNCFLSMKAREMVPTVSLSSEDGVIDIPAPSEEPSSLLEEEDKLSVSMKNIDSLTPLQRLLVVSKLPISSLADELPVHRLYEEKRKIKRRFL